jgi:ribosome-binding protein aMBF1 (putative translation factor)
MVECAKCGASGDTVALFDAISRDGVIKICEACAFKEDIPIIRKPTSDQLRAINTPRSVYVRLSSMAKLNPKEHREKFSGYPHRQSETPKQITTLRELVDRDYEKKSKGEIQKTPRPDLVDNFHWVIMKARRMKKLSFAQVSKEIAEPEKTLELAEKGILPDDLRFIKKLESYYGISLEKKDPMEVRKKPAEVQFEDIVTKNMTVADLKEIQKEREILGPVEEELPEESEEIEGEEIEEDFEEEYEEVEEDDEPKTF